MISENPFYFGRIVAGNAFTDREKDTQRLITNFRNGINMVLISPRRLGKSSLVQKAGETIMSKNIRIAYIIVAQCMAKTRSNLLLPLR